VPLPSPLWSEAVGAALAVGTPPSPMPPMPPAGSWTPELMSLFAGTAADEEVTKEAASSSSEDPLCLSTYLTPPISSSTVEKVCVSPFELEKRPKPLPQPAPTEAKACTTLAEDDSYNLFDDGQPFMKEAEYTEFLETLLAL